MTREANSDRKDMSHCSKLFLNLYGSWEQGAALLTSLYSSLKRLSLPAGVKTDLFPTHILLSSDLRARLVRLEVRPELLLEEAEACFFDDEASVTQQNKR